MRSDAELLEAWRADDRSAGRELFARYYPLLMRFFANKVSVDPIDLIQETLLACVHSHHRLRDGQRFRGFLFGIAYNKLKGFYRRRSGHEVPFDPTMHAAVDLSPGPSTMVGDGEQQRLLLLALRTIPLEHQVLLELFYWEGATSAEIAELLAMPHNTVRTRIRRSRALLEQALEACADDPRVLEQTRTGLEGWAAQIREAHASPPPP